MIIILSNISIIIPENRSLPPSPSNMLTIMFCCHHCIVTSSCPSSSSTSLNISWIPMWNRNRVGGGRYWEAIGNMYILPSVCIAEASLDVYWMGVIWHWGRAGRSTNHLNILSRWSSILFRAREISKRRSTLLYRFSAIMWTGHLILSLPKTFHNTLVQD